MLRPIKLSDLKLPMPNPKAREETLKRVEQFQQAQADLEKRCEELGIPVPEMVC